MEDKMNSLLQKYSPTKEQEQTDNRDHFDNQIEYIFAVVGFGVGYGSFWRFPYLVYQDGGSGFLIPYFILVVVMGIPLFYLECALGQMFQKTPPKIFQKIHISLKFVGYISVFIAFNMSTYYNTILTYSYMFFFNSFQDPLPWSFTTDKNDILNSQFFYKQMLQKSSSINQFGGIQWHLAIIYVVSMFICYFAISKGVKITGKITIITASLPYLFMFVLLMKGLTLTGASNGIIFLLTPDFKKLMSPTVWMQAAAQVFFQFSIGCSSLIMFSSFRQKKHRFDNVTYIIVISTVAFGIMSALIIFIYINHFCYQNNMNMQDLQLSGPALAFIVFPKALTILPWSNFWAILFFITLILLGIDSQFGFLQGCCCALQDQFRQNNAVILGFQIPHNKLRLMTVSVISCFTILYSSRSGFYYLSFIDGCTCNIPLGFAVLSEVYFYTKYIPFSELQAQVQKHTKAKTPDFIKKVIQSNYLLILTGGMVIIGIIKQLVEIRKYNFIVNVIGWIIVMYSLIIAAVYFYKKDGYQKFIRKNSLQQQL